MRFVCPLDDPANELDAAIGARARSLRHLHRLGVPVPPGFAVTDVACRRFLDTGDLPAEMWEQVEEAVHRAIDVCSDGGLILGSSGEIHPEVKPENAIALFRAAKRYSGR